MVYPTTRAPQSGQQQDGSGRGRLGGVHGLLAEQVGGAGHKLLPSESEAAQGVDAEHVPILLGSRWPALFI